MSEATGCPRQCIERREDETLAPCAVHASRSRGRKHPEPPHERRTCFQRDRGRVVHCSAFRRSQYKTQVFVNDEGDHFRTRLTHTLEVTGLARNVARVLGVNEDLTEVVALAHDLGHTPFGHAGESVLDELMATHGGFEHNAQSLRVVDVLEEPYPGFRGLNLSYEVRECVAKHASLHDRPAGGGEFDLAEAPPIEGQLVDVADQIAYDSHDMEDAFRAGLITPEDPAGLELWQQAAELVQARFPGAAGQIAARRTAKQLIELMITDALTVAAANLADLAPAGVDDVRATGRRMVAFSADMRRRMAPLEQFLMERVYRHYRVTRMMTKAARFVREMFTAYLERPNQLPSEYQQRIRDGGESPHRVICDYIAGMTDRYCQDEYLRLFMPFERT
jgi:dGTPase